MPASLVCDVAQPPTSAWLAVDPRSRSTQSLLSSIGDSGSDPEATATGQRRLLVVYIHGYQGNDTSFRQFPFHVHQYLKHVLHTHFLHTKIYPRYKTYRSIDLATERFSTWLGPHESDSTDIVLVGHSMGGLLAADFALMSNKEPHRHLFSWHRLLGIVAVDSPFLGLHPGIIVSGISSIFRPAQDPAINDDAPDSGWAWPSPPLDATMEVSSIAASASNYTTPDPSFNPQFFNDDPFKERPWVDRMFNFLQKNSSKGLMNAVGQHIFSHLEYGGCLADIPGLISRHERLRSLERGACSAVGNVAASPVRVRFVNYYTCCTGRPKPRSASPEPPRGLAQLEAIGTTSASSTPKMNIEDHSDPAYPIVVTTEGREPAVDSDPAVAMAGCSLNEIGLAVAVQDKELGLPPIPEVPTRPESPDLDQFTDTKLKKQVEKEANRARKVYKQAIKDRESALTERRKLIERQQQLAKKQLDMQQKAREKQHVERTKIRRKESPAASDASKHTAPTIAKERKFCNLPPKVNSVRDESWVCVSMGSVDEVTAHTSLFLPGPHYEQLVKDVGSRIVGWLDEIAVSVGAV